MRTLLSTQIGRYIDPRDLAALLFVGALALGGALWGRHSKGTR